MRPPRPAVARALRAEPEAAAGREAGDGGLGDRVGAAGDQGLVLQHGPVSGKAMSVAWQTGQEI